MTKRPFVYRPRTFEDLRKHLSATPEETWSHIETEHGPPKSMSDTALKQRLVTELRIAGILDQDHLCVPPAVAERVLSDVIDKLRRAARAADHKQAVATLNRLFQRWRASLPRRPRHRPRQSFAARNAEWEAVHEFAQRQLRLMRSGLSRDNAINQAAGEIAPQYGVKPATLISWWQHPGRRRRKPWRRTV